MTATHGCLDAVSGYCLRGAILIFYIVLNPLSKSPDAFVAKVKSISHHLHQWIVEGNSVLQVVSSEHNVRKQLLSFMATVE